MTCQYCEFNPKRGGRWLHDYRGPYCSSELACFNRILRRNRVLYSAGRRMANLCFNLKQQAGMVLTLELCEKMAELCIDWDKAKKQG